MINVGGTTPTPILELAELVQETMGIPQPLRARFVPYDQLPGSYQDVRVRIPDTTKAERVLGFRAQVPLREGLERTLAWHVDRRQVLVGAAGPSAGTTSMTTEVLTRRPEPAVRERAELSGAWLLSAGMLVSGGLTYAFHLLVARTLGPDDFGRIAVLWAAVFLVATAVFRPLEQTTARAVADRLARGEDARSVLRSVATVCVCAMVLAGCAMAAAWRPITDRLFQGDNFLSAMLVVGVLLFSLVYVGRGLSSAACAGSAATPPACASTASCAC